MPALAEPSSNPAKTPPGAVVDSLEATFGRQLGQRRNHTKGVCAAGEFSPTAEARNFSRSPLFAGPLVPVLARFSVAGGRPGTPDTARNPRGLGLRFTLPGGAFHQMALLHVPVFGAATPESFHARLEADRPDPATGKPDPARQAAVAERYTDNKALGAWFAQHRPPASYTQAAFHSLHAFRFVDGAGAARWVKWRFVPRDGEAELGDDELKAAPPNFLEAALQQRLAKSAAEWDLVLTVGEAGDPIDNPTLAWPKDRREVTIGRLAISRSGGSDCEGVNFDPLVLSDGVEPSPDPVLHFRSAAYAQSFSRRTVERTAKP
jgi:catalase